jgi:CPA2 family monovalent cation:H+ antiporter-2
MLHNPRQGKARDPPRAAERLDQMAAPAINFGAYSDALIALGTAGVVVPLVHRWRVNPVLGYLAAGVVLGPLGLGSFKNEVPLLRWVTVADVDNVAEIAQLGVVFLLFLIGLELSLQRLLTMRRLVFGLGGLQVAGSAALIGAFAVELGNGAAASLIIGLCLALSSTAIVLEVLSGHRRLTSAAGRASFSVLLFQDLAIVPVLLLIGILGESQGGSVVAGLAKALMQAAIAVLLIVAIGRWLLRPLLRMVASLQARELFVAANLFLVVATAVAAAAAGVSMALGAFVAGLMLAETEYRKAIATTIEPFKGILLGMFFFTVGMSVDLRELARAPLSLLSVVGGLIAAKALLLAGLARLFRLPWPAAIETGLLLGPCGEFAFVGIGLATTLGLIAADASRFLLAATSLSMAVIPLLAHAGRRISASIEKRKPIDAELAALPAADGSARAIVVGHGRVGQVVSAMLERHRTPFIATDRDPDAVTAYRRRGREVYYGDATDPAFLMSCGLMQTPAVIVTIHDQAAIDEIVRVARELRPDVLIVSRARDAEHARHLYAIGVSDAVPETIEASLQLSEAALVGLGLPTGPVIASIHEQRDAFRRQLQEAATRAGQSESRSIRAKTTR